MDELKCGCLRGVHSEQLDKMSRLFGHSGDGRVVSEDLFKQ